MRREFFDKLSELRLQERKGCFVIVPSDTDYFLPRLSQFITYSPQTTKQLVRHSISNSRYILESRLPVGPESLISKKKKKSRYSGRSSREQLGGWEVRASEIWGCPRRQNPKGSQMNISFQNKSFSALNKF